MSTNYPAVRGELSAAIAELRKGIPETMQGFSDMAAAATADGVLDPKTKELVAIAIAVAARCDGCIAFHARAAVRFGASREEILETLGMAIYMGGGPSMIYAAQTLKAYDQFVAEGTPARRAG
ncbi:MAG: carboxymuconolactone decarboxylase family protein [Magnetovibrio sp.]|nr:carboxymuconolactone decarboxylase family protein [Magnetovibrio sp.]